MVRVSQQQSKINTAPGATEFRLWATHILDHQTLPDVALNGNMGVFHQWAFDLTELYEELGYQGFVTGLEALQRKHKEISIALSSPEEEADVHFEFLEFGDLKTLPVPEWMIYRFLPTKGVNFVYGPAGEGKTYLLTGLNVAVASPELNWQGLATRHGHCIYIAAEDIDEVAQRFIGCANYHQLKDIPNLHIFPASLQLVKDTPKLIESIKHKYGDIDIALITVDTLAMCSLGIEENSKKEFDAVTASLEALWRTYNCCVVAVHHTGRNGEIRGTSSMDGVAYSMIKVKKADESVLIHSDKMRRGKAFEDFFLDWETIDVPGAFDEMGEQVTTGVLIRSDRSSNTDPCKITKLQQEILEHIHNLGGKDVSRTELMKACLIEQARERSFINAISGLLGRGLISMLKQKQRTFYNLVEQEEVTA